MLDSTIPLTSTSSCCSVRLMWKRSLICLTVEGPCPKQGRREPVTPTGGGGKKDCSDRFPRTAAFLIHLMQAIKFSSAVIIYYVAM